MIDTTKQLMWLKYLDMYEYCFESSEEAVYCTWSEGYDACAKEKNDEISVLKKEIIALNAELQGCKTTLRLEDAKLDLAEKEAWLKTGGSHQELTAITRCVRTSQECDGNNARCAKCTGTFHSTKPAQAKGGE